jgi:DNA-directed RNA polymerase subunit RPC12/RpoP
MLTYRRVAQTLMLPFCWLRGHHYNTPDFHPKALYFCTRCGREILGRTYDDIEPMTDEEWQQERRERDLREGL